MSKQRKKLDRNTVSFKKKAGALNRAYKKASKHSYNTEYWKARPRLTAKAKKKLTSSTTTTKKKTAAKKKKK